MTAEIKYQNKEEAIAVVTKDYRELIYCTPELRNDEEVVWETIKQHSWSFYHASDTLKSNKAFIMRSINDGSHSEGLIANSNISIQSDIDVMTLALEKSPSGGVFCYAQGDAALNKELAAKALVKHGNKRGAFDLDLWNSLHHTLQEFFPRDIYYEKAKSYLMQLEYQLEQKKQAEMVAGGSTTEDAVVW